MNFDNDQAQRKWMFIHVPKTAGTYFKNRLSAAAKKTDMPDPNGLIYSKLMRGNAMPRELFYNTIWLGVENLNFRVENLGHSFPYKFVVNNWNPKGVDYSYQAHLTDMEYHLHFRPYYDAVDDGIDYVSIVRNPFALFYSYWRYTAKRFETSSNQLKQLAEYRVSHGIAHSGWANCNVIMKTASFKDFVNHYLDDDKEWHIPPLKQNIFAQLYTRDNKLIPKHENILRCENIKADFEAWCQTNDIPFGDIDESMSNINPNPESYKDKYSPLQIYLLKEKWADILQTFNYDF